MLRITKDDKSMLKFPKPKPNISKLWKPDNNVFHKHKLRCTLCPITSCLMKPTTEFIKGNDGAIIRKYSCDITKCHNSMWFCEKCGKSTNTCADKKELLDIKTGVIPIKMNH